jgi:hypothetical protein
MKNMSYKTSLLLASSIWGYACIFLFIITSIIGIITNIGIVVVPLLGALITIWTIFPITFFLKYLDKLQIEEKLKTVYLAIFSYFLLIIPSLIIIAITDNIFSLIIMLFILITSPFLIFPSTFYVMNNEWNNSEIIDKKIDSLE